MCVDTVHDYQKTSVAPFIDEEETSEDNIKKHKKYHAGFDHVCNRGNTF